MHFGFSAEKLTYAVRLLKKGIFKYFSALFYLLATKIYVEKIIRFLRTQGRMAFKNKQKHFPPMGKRQTNSKILTQRTETPPETKPNQPTTQNPTNPRSEQSLGNTCSRTLSAVSCLKSLGTFRRCLVWTDSACMQKACESFFVASVNNHNADAQKERKATEKR